MDFQFNELQKSLDNVVGSQYIPNEKLSQAYKDAISDYLKNLDLLNEIQETTRKVCADFTSANELLHQKIQDTVVQFSISISTSTDLQEAIRKSQIKTTTGVVNAISKSIPKFSMINDSVLSCLASLKKSSSDDFVMIDDSLIHEINIPDEMVLPVGNYRVKMSTALFVSIIGTVIGWILTIFISICTFGGGDVSSDIKEQNQIIIEQNQMLIDQAQLLSDLLDSADASESSQVDVINSWKESILTTND